MTKIAVIIKTFNEESNVERAIRSSLAAVAPYGGEVIVSDSASTDRTVERAVLFPITVVQLQQPSQRCCGVGPQLGYQHCNAEYVYILDGDMDLDPEFIEQAIKFLDEQPSVAGVGGFVREMRIDNLEFQARVNRQHRRLRGQTSDVEALAGGGLYRRTAIEEVGYFSDRNLHGYEEYDLGVRLRKRGWRLVRFETHAADHYSYSKSTFGLLLYRLRAGSFLSSGEILRTATEKGYVTDLLRRLSGVRVAAIVWLYWVAIASTGFWLSAQNWAIALMIGLVLPLLAMAVRTRSWTLGPYSVLLWHINALGLLLGFVRRRVPPTQRIASSVCRTV